MSKFSDAIFSSSLLDRRQFLSCLTATCLYQDCLASLASSKANSRDYLYQKHFYWLDIREGKVHLPSATIIDHGQPGSLMKLLATTTILQENLPIANQSIDCRGKITVAGRTYVCRHPHGKITLPEALGQSCNVFFAQAAKQIPVEGFLKYLGRFGLEQCLNIADQSKVAHQRKTAGQRYINKAELVLGLLPQYDISAWQILQLIGLIATRGNLPAFNFEANGNAIKSISAPNPSLNELTWNILQVGMQISCRKGTAKDLDPDNKLHIAAKTGTTLHGKTFQSWLAGYFPYQEPKYVFCMRAPCGTSYDAAVPLARNYLFNHQW